MLLVPAVVVCCFVWRASGGPSLSWFRTFLVLGVSLWIWTGAVGLLLAVGGSYLAKWSGEGYRLILAHAVSLGFGLIIRAWIAIPYAP
jgi:hypothetical protein